MLASATLNVNRAVHSHHGLRGLGLALKKTRRLMTAGRMDDGGLRFWALTFPLGQAVRERQSQLALEDLDELVAQQDLDYAQWTPHEQK